MKTAVTIAALCGMLCLVSLRSNAQPAADLMAGITTVKDGMLTLRAPRSSYVGAEGDGHFSPRWEGGPRKDAVPAFALVWESYEPDENGKPKRNKIGAVETVGTQRFVFPFTNVARIARVPIGPDTGWEWVKEMEVCLRDGSKTVITHIENRVFELRTVSPTGETKERKIGDYHLWHSEFTGYLGGIGTTVQSATKWRGLEGTLVNPDGAVAQTNKFIYDFEILKIEFKDRTTGSSVP